MQNMKVNSDVRFLVHHDVDIGLTALCKRRGAEVCYDIFEKYGYGIRTEAHLPLLFIAAIL